MAERSKIQRGGTRPSGVSPTASSGPAAGLRRRLGYYLVGLAIGAMIAGMIAMRRQAAGQAQDAADGEPASERQSRPASDD